MWAWQREEQPYFWKTPGEPRLRPMCPAALGWRHASEGVCRPSSGRNEARTLIAEPACPKSAPAVAGQANVP
jgi:hypothetical protein